MKSKQHNQFTIIATSLIAFAAVSDAAIVYLEPSQSVGLSIGATAAEYPSLVGEVLIDFPQNFTILDSLGETLFKGVLRSRVRSRFDTGELDFSWNIRDSDPSVSGKIALIMFSGFEGYDTGIGWRPDTQGDTEPAMASRDTFADIITISFITPLLHSGVDSKSFFSRSDAFDYALTGTATIMLNTGEFTVLNTFAPIPEPGTSAILGTLMLGLATRRRRSAYKQNQ